MAITVSDIQAGGYTAQQDRKMLRALVAKAGPPNVRAGIMPWNGFELGVTAQSTPNMSVQVAMGQIVIPDANGGAYVLDNDATVPSVAIAAANATNPRIDLIIARVYDNEIGDAAPTQSLTLPGTAGSVNVQQYTGTIEVVQGTPTPGATVAANSPALPNSRCVILAAITVRAATTSILNGDISTSTRAQFTVANGGIVPLRSASDRPSGVFGGYACYRQDTGNIEVWNGSSWDIFPVNGLQSINGASNVPATAAGNKVQSDTFTASFSASAAAAGSITFPVAFTTTPVVVASVQVGSNLDILVNTVSVTNAAFSWRAFTNTSGTVTASATVHWIAIGT